MATFMALPLSTFDKVISDSHLPKSACDYMTQQGITEVLIA